MNVSETVHRFLLTYERQHVSTVMRSSSGLTIRDTNSHEDYAPIWDPIGVTYLLKLKKLTI